MLKILNITIIMGFCWFIGWAYIQQGRHQRAFEGVLERVVAQAPTQEEIAFQNEIDAEMKRLERWRLPVKKKGK